MSPVVNALDYGAAGTAVRVTVSGGEGDVRVAVANSGPPIERRKLAEIFAPLKRGPDHDKNKSGLGLGLYIAQEIAKAHGGDVKADRMDRKPYSPFTCLTLAPRPRSRRRRKNAAKNRQCDEFDSAEPARNCF